jgi:Uma2 family endonuclease
MRTVLLGERPPEVEKLIAQRHALGQDLFDEVWEGEYHMAPAAHGRHGRVDAELAATLHSRARHVGLWDSGPCNIGTPDDYRVPDRSFLADQVTRTFYPTAEVVVEIVSPDDESRNKFDFYFRAGVKEVGIVDPGARTVEWFARGEARFQPADGSVLLGVSAKDLAEEIDWPQ